MDSSGDELAECGQILAHAESLDAVWIVLDGYHFSSAYQRAVKASGRQVLAVDDLAHLGRYHVDALLNQNPAAKKLAYGCQPTALKLFGADYALVHPRFVASRDAPRAITPVARRILITLGGADPKNVSLRVIQALRRLDTPDLAATIVVGPANRHLESLRKAVAGDEERFRLIIDPPEMGSWMALADVAITAAGSTCWELACLGLPSLAIIVADNQVGLAGALAARDAIRLLGWEHELSVERLEQEVLALLDDPPARQLMSQRGRELVDGRARPAWHGSCSITRFICGRPVRRTPSYCSNG